SERYDLISIEVGQLSRPGVPYFYTTDFYRLARARLRPGGVVSQLLKLSLPPPVFRGAIASFREVFPDAVLWFNTSECLLLGTAAGRLTFDRRRLALLDSSPAVARDFEQRFYGSEEFSLRRPEVFLGGCLCGPSGLAALAAGATPFRDDPPRLDYLASRQSTSETNVPLYVEELPRGPHPIPRLA